MQEATSNLMIKMQQQQMNLVPNSNDNNQALQPPMEQNYHHQILNRQEQHNQLQQKHEQQVRHTDLSNNMEEEIPSMILK
jgi:hypothetical protein